MNVEIYEPTEPSEDKPLAIIEFPKLGVGPALELHIWDYKGRTQVEWVTEDGVGLGMMMGAEC
jgi:hypothetical protein